MTRFWTIVDRPTSLQIHAISNLLLEGGVVLLPTDTIYGLHALALDEAAVARIVEIKGRDDRKPFIVLAASTEQLVELGVTIDPSHLRALNEIWPAPLTAILPLRQPVAASRGATTLGVRVPDLDWLREIVARTGPLVSSSANRSGEPAVATPTALARGLQNRIDAIVDAGSIQREPSAILDLSSAEPRLIREGDPSFTQNLWKTLRKSP